MTEPHEFDPSDPEEDDAPADTCRQCGVLQGDHVPPPRPYVTGVASARIVRLDDRGQPTGETIPVQGFDDLRALVADSLADPLADDAKPFVLPDLRDRSITTSIPVTDETAPSLGAAFGIRPPFEDRLTAADLYAAVESLSQPVQYEPERLILHPMDHATMSMDPDKPETIEMAKRIADAFEVPYWMVPIPGYEPPRRARILRRLLRIERAVRNAPGLLPGVQRYQRPDWGWGEPPKDARGGRYWVRAGRWAVGRYQPEDWDL